MVDLLHALAGTEPVGATSYTEALVIPVIIAVVAGLSSGGGFWVFLAKRAERKAAESKQDDPWHQLLLGLAYDRILFLGDKYIQRGFITPSEYDGFLKYVWLPYQKLGGNGLGQKIFEEVSELPLETFNDTPGQLRVAVVNTRKEKR